MTIQILHALSATTTVVALDSDVGRLETAKRMGADEALLSGDETIARIMDITAQQGAQLVLDMVGRPDEVFVEHLMRHKAPPSPPSNMRLIG